MKAHLGQMKEKFAQTRSLYIDKIETINTRN